MFAEIDTKLTSAVEVEARAAYTEMFPDGDSQSPTRAFSWASDCFTGRYADYQRIDARYHDFEHTLQGTTCFVQLLLGRSRARIDPKLTCRLFELGLLAILLHDTGYLKKNNDREGTGAKYTSVHVNRSCDFAREFLTGKGFKVSEILSVQNMIRCTGVNVDLGAVPFQSDLERIVGFALGTADLLGQMAAKDYVEKLPVLYGEFEESARFNLGRGAAPGMFSSARDLMEKTPFFWEKYVVPKINKDFDGLYKFLGAPFPDGPNKYLVKIEENISKIREQLVLTPA